MLDATLLFMPNISQQSHKQESKMQIEHTSRRQKTSQKYMCVGALRRSTGCFNQQSLNTVSQPEVSHNPLGQPDQSTPKVNESQWSMQIAAAARSMQQSQSQLPASGIVPKNAD